MIRVNLSEKLLATIYEDGKVEVRNRVDFSPVCEFPLTSVFAMLYQAEGAGIRMKFRIDPTDWRGVEGL